MYSNLQTTSRCGFVECQSRYCRRIMHPHVASCRLWPCPSESTVASTTLQHCASMTAGTWHSALRGMPLLSSSSTEMKTMQALDSHSSAHQPLPHQATKVRRWFNSIRLASQRVVVQLRVCTSLKLSRVVPQTSTAACGLAFRWETEQRLLAMILDLCALVGVGHQWPKRDRGVCCTLYTPDKAPAEPQSHRCGSKVNLVGRTPW